MAPGEAAVGAPADDLYHRILLASRAREVEPETAAIVSAIALDAHRINEELGAAADLPTATLPSWRALFAP
jgi:hypothetical protein